MTAAPNLHASTDPASMVAGTGGELLARQLLAEGVDTLFGVPGAQLDWAVDGLAKCAPGIRFVHARHEQGAAYMADGYARSSGRVGTMMVVPGPGMLNAAAGLSTAWACSSPVVAIIGAIPTTARGRRLGVLHEIADPEAIIGSLTKWHAVADDPSDIPALVSEAFRQARSGRPRPVAIQVPADVFARAGQAELITPRAPQRTAPDGDLVAAAAALLASAQRPVIVAGAGVVAADAQAELAEVARLAGAPVFTTANGRSALSNHHDLVATPPVGRELLADADVVLAAGTRFVNLQGSIVTAAQGRRLIQINADPDDLAGERRAEIAIHADAALGLAALAGELTAVAAPGAASRPLARLAELRAWYGDRAAELAPLDGYVAALRRALPDDGIVVADLTQVGYLCNATFPVYEPRSYLTSGWQGTLGYAFPTALGAKVAHPDRPVVSISGDGGFGFTLNELATAAAHRIGVVAVCFDDGAYGNVRRAQATTFDGRYLATELTNPDFVALAEAFGVAGVRADSPAELETAVADAINRPGPTLIVAPMGEVPSPWRLLDDRPVHPSNQP